MFLELTARIIAESVEIPISYDQRLMGLQTYAFEQKSCGSCWAATVANAAEAGLLRARRLLQVPESTSDMRVSTEWILEESFNNEGCEGGDFYFGVKDIENLGGSFMRNIQIPYKGSDGVENEVQHVFGDLYQIFDNYDEPFSEAGDEVITMKYLISRGIPVVTVMSLESIPWLQREFLSNWNGDILKGACTKQIDHEVVIVGYGLYKGEQCWLVKNSWGSGFGEFGYFYVKIGTDTLCTERSLYAVLPQGFSFKESVFSLEAAEENGLEMVYGRGIRRGLASFDLDNGTYRSWRFVGYLSILEGAVCVFATSLAVGIAVGVRKRIKDGRWRR